MPAARRSQAESSERPLRRRAVMMARAGARAHAQTEAVRLGAATVVRLEGALAHEVLRCLRDGRQAPTRSRVQSSGSTADCCCWRPQSASPWIDATATRRAPRACERGRRHARSTIREQRKGGQTGPLPPDSEPQSLHLGPSRLACKSTRRGFVVLAGGAVVSSIPVLLGCGSHDVRPSVPSAVMHRVWTIVWKTSASGAAR